VTADRPAAVIVLAAGGGTRMKSSTPKVLHRLGGRSLVGHVLSAARALEPHHLAVVVRHDRDRVAAHARELDGESVIVDQDEVAGTGRAAQCGLQALPQDLTGTVIVTYGDVPLQTPDMLAALLDAHVEAGNAVTVLTGSLEDPQGYGRILRGDDGTVTAIVEEKDATAQQRQIKEINSGIFAFDAKVLRDALEQVSTANAAGEMYLTDVVGVVHRDGRRVGALPAPDTWQIEGVNTRAQLAELGKELNRRLLEHWMSEGVEVIDPATTWVDVTVTLASDVTLKPGVQLHGSTSVGRDATIGPETTLTDVSVGAGASVVRTHGVGAVIGERATVGPFASLRAGTVLGADGKIGTFVETKNARIDDGAKVPHLSYVGDATIGASTNIGAGTIFANYDGVAKHSTVIGAHAKTGSNNTFVAPVEVGDGAATGAGTVVRRDVPAGALAVSGGPQRNLEGWVRRRRANTPAAAAAAAATTRATDSPDEVAAPAAKAADQAISSDQTAAARPEEATE
jgi:bifunctional UDP-N-acetylglucosamine pyrophosphorylase / glucosamine-1-phosphate N-acetyltransferase